MKELAKSSQVRGSLGRLAETSTSAKNDIVEEELLTVCLWVSSETLRCGFCPRWKQAENNSWYPFECYQTFAALLFLLFQFGCHGFWSKPSPRPYPRRKHATSIERGVPWSALTFRMFRFPGSVRENESKPCTGDETLLAWARKRLRNPNHVYNTTNGHR